jgi:DNA primase
LRQSKPYLEYLLDRAAMQHNLRTPEGRARFVDDVLPVVDRIPDRTRQELFVKEVSARANVSEDAIWPRAKKAVTTRSAGITSSQLPALGQVTKAEKGLIWWLIHEPAPALAALSDLDHADFDGLAARSVLDLARGLNENRGFSPPVLLERLNMVEAQLVTAIASESEPPALSLTSCVREFRRARYERERAAVQREIAQLQTRGAASGGEIDALLARKGDLGRLIQALVVAED